jgi:hypothetical protein
VSLQVKVCLNLGLELSIAMVSGAFDDALAASLSA